VACHCPCNWRLLALVHGCSATPTALVMRSYSSRDASVTERHSEYQSAAWLATASTPQHPQPPKAQPFLHGTPHRTHHPPLQANDVPCKGRPMPQRDEKPHPRPIVSHAVPPLIRLHQTTEPTRPINVYHLISIPVVKPVRWCNRNQ